MSQPLLTLAIPTWNRDGFLATALDSLCGQAAPHADKVEIIVSDNASDDQTPQIIAEACTRFPGLIHPQRHARNLGLVGNALSVMAAARGRHLMIYGDDDIMVPGALGRVLTILGQRPRLAVAVFQQIPTSGLHPLTDGERLCTIVEFARAIFYYAGNFGVFLVRTDLARVVMTHRPPYHAWTYWPQTEVIFLAAVASGYSRPVLLTSVPTSSSPNHLTNLRRTGFYIWKTMLLDLHQTALNLRNEAGEAVFDEAVRHLFAVKRLDGLLKEVVNCLLTTDTRSDWRRLRTLTTRSWLRIGEGSWLGIARGFLIAWSPAFLLRQPAWQKLLSHPSGIRKDWEKWCKQRAKARKERLKARKLEKRERRNRRASGQ